MKRLISILFISILLLQVAGSYVYFIVRLSAIRNEMRQQLAFMPEKDLTQFTFTHQQFESAKVDDHEFQVKGKMYDIARIQTQGKKVLVFALHDEAEDSLLTLLNEILKRSSKDKKPVPSSVLQLLTLQLAISEVIDFASTAKVIQHRTSYLESVSDFAAVISAPPPRD